MKVNGYDIPPIGTPYIQGHRLASDVLFDVIFNAGGCAVAHDFGPNSIDGTPSALTMYHPEGYQLNGTNQHVGFGNPPEVALSNNFTICAWIKPGSSGNRTIVGKWNPDVSSTEWLLRWGFDDIVHFSVTAGGTVDGSNTITMGKRTFFSARMLGGTVQLFIQGRIDGSSGAGRSITPGTANLTVGRVDDSSFYGDGVYERVLIYGRPLRQSDIQSLYEAPYQMFQRANLKRYFLGSVAAAPADPIPIGWRSRYMAREKNPVHVFQ